MRRLLGICIWFAADFQKIRTRGVWNGCLGDTPTAWTDVSSDVENTCRWLRNFRARQFWVKDVWGMQQRAIFLKFFHACDVSRELSFIFVWLPDYVGARDIFAVTDEDATVTALLEL